MNKNRRQDAGAKSEHEMSVALLDAVQEDGALGPLDRRDRHLRYAGLAVANFKDTLEEMYRARLRSRDWASLAGVAEVGALMADDLERMGRGLWHPHLLRPELSPGGELALNEALEAVQIGICHQAIDSAPVHDQARKRQGEPGKPGDIEAVLDRMEKGLAEAARRDQGDAAPEAWAGIARRFHALMEGKMAFTPGRSWRRLHWTAYSLVWIESHPEQAGRDLWSAHQGGDGFVDLSSDARERVIQHVVDRLHLDWPPAPQ